MRDGSNVFILAKAFYIFIYNKETKRVKTCDGEANIYFYCLYVVKNKTLVFIVVMFCT